MPCTGSGRCSCSRSSQTPTGAGSGPNGKLDSVDRHADKTRAFLHEFIDQYWDELVLMAKGRLVRGHFQFGDRNYKEWDAERLLAELSEEIADAINYGTERWVKLDG